ncbi:hypothetical protein M0657_004940 [Pyricularia oryzae]|nr:hypothetical protein M9X92_005967 [Pyricularia oryzae]KAI7923778.1 hypothetical protein M0657_004940 [Pyricularia oryzae]
MYRVVGPIGCTGGKYPCSYNGKNGYVEGLIRHAALNTRLRRPNNSVGCNVAKEYNSLLRNVISYRTTAIKNCDHPTIFIGLFCATINHVRNKMIIALITEGRWRLILAKRMRWDSSKESQNLAFAKLA